MKKWLLFALLVIGGFWLAKPVEVFCAYCSGGTPCYSDVDCPLGCRCQAPPYMQGVCIPTYP